MSSPIMASAALGSGGDHMVELAPYEPESLASDSEDARSVASDDDVATLLIQPEKKPKFNIFSVSHSRRQPREQATRYDETDTSPPTQFMFWVWSGSRYSGLLCMTFSSVIYFLMEVVSNVFIAQSVPLLETAFTRYTFFVVLSYWWLRKSGHPVLGPAQARNLLGLRAITGFLSVLSFVYYIQMVPLSLAIVLSSTTPVIASIMARIILKEKLKIQDIGGLACCFFGVLFIFQLELTTQGWNTNRGNRHMFAVLVGLFSSVTGGVSYCLIKAGAKASDQPVVTIFSFGVLASPAAGVCALALEDLVLPSLYSLCIMVILAVMAFFAELFLARGLQLEKTSRAANILYIEVALSLLWRMGWSMVSVSFGRLVGCFLIFVSVCYTLYDGPDKEME